jgi:hypothetical protein
MYFLYETVVYDVMLVKYLYIATDINDIHIMSSTI